MSSKRNSVTVPSIEFTRTVNASKEDKCREFWKYLDEKNILEPYQPPKLNETKNPCKPCNNSKAKSTEKESKFASSKDAKPKQTKPAAPQKPTKAPNSCDENSYYEKIMRKGVKLAECELSFDDLMIEIDEYDKRIGQEIICPIYNQPEECPCNDEDDVIQVRAEECKTQV